MLIERIKIAGFKSIAELTLNNVTPYSVFAGPNGAGKSNLLDALAFVGEIVDAGASKAISRFGGFQNIRCFKLSKQKAATFKFALEMTFGGKKICYKLKLSAMDSEPSLRESMHVDGESLFEMHSVEFPRPWPGKSKPSDQAGNWPENLSWLMFFPDTEIYQFLRNIRIFRFDPSGAKESDSSSTDARELNPSGNNLATILAKMERDKEFSAQIIDWLELLVPGLEQVRTEKQRLDGSRLITFKEEGTKTRFPAHLISDGTIYALCIMTAVLSRAKGIGMTLIEEPERGMHPDAIHELVQLMRENASPGHPILITSHSESVVRASKIEELWLVDKIDGKTTAKNAAPGSADLSDINLDKAWLMNMFGAGLPW